LAYYIFLILHILSAIPYIFALFFLIRFLIIRKIGWTTGELGQRIECFPELSVCATGSTSTRKQPANEGSRREISK